jgi:hypothetical protein
MAESGASEKRPTGECGGINTEPTAQAQTMAAAMTSSGRWHSAANHCGAARHHCHVPRRPGVAASNFAASESASAAGVSKAECMESIAMMCPWISVPGWWLSCNSKTFDGEIQHSDFTCNFPA